ncbi:MAG: hypothetical protein MUP58_02045 [Candidatus Nanohaloarchaeota archaeon QJJ-9]|nr:hypothetical protein [Candidatus Nanohaloarchaeota archaeon QJJ-9]
MRKFIVPALVLFFVLQVSAVNFSISSSCEDYETALFSISNESNAHAAEPGFYNLQVCAEEVGSTGIKKECEDIANPVLSFYQPDSGIAHLSAKDDRNEYVLCSKKLATSVWKNCPSGSKPIVSIYDSVENHIAEPGIYDWQVCGAVFDDVTLAYNFTMSGNKTFVANMEETSDNITDTASDLPGYAAAQNSSVISGVVGEGSPPHNVEIRNESGRVVIKHNINNQNNLEWFIPFTRGDYFDIENRLGMIDSNEFLSKFNPNFAFELADHILVKVSLELTQADIANYISIGPGIHNLVIENQGDSKVSINATEE